MKCSNEECYDHATVHIVEVRGQKLTGRTSMCEKHKWAVSPFADPGSGITSLGICAPAGSHRFDVNYVVFFDRHQADGLFLHEVGGVRRFSIPVLRHQANLIVEAIQRTGDHGRPFTFTGIAMMLHAVGAVVEQVAVDEIEGQGDYYHARITVRNRDRCEVLDIRPSDAFALAIACRAPILIADGVLVRAAELGWTEPPNRHSSGD